jgi:hypothetical protein
LESRGTRQRAFFAVRKQHTKQVKSGEAFTLNGVHLLGA